jgi:hypothetical protein
MRIATNWENTGFYIDAVDVENAMETLKVHLTEVGHTFHGFDEESLKRKPSPGKWSKKEILGHLIDSAINNLQRFTEIPFKPQPYTVVSYRQDELVAANHYQDLPLDHLLQLWKSLNQQIVFVVAQIPPGKLQLEVDAGYGNREMKSFGWLICDYVAHLEHHLQQLK